MHADHDEPGTDANLVYHEHAYGYALYNPECDPNANDSEPDDDEPDRFTHTNRYGDTFAVIIADADADPVLGEQLHSAAIGMRLPRRDEHRRSSRYPAHRRQR